MSELEQTSLYFKLTYFKLNWDSPETNNGNGVSNNLS